MTGNRSSVVSVLLQLSQNDRGVTIDRPVGRRSATTFMKLPNEAPNAKDTRA